MKWTVIYEQDPDSGDWGAHAADLPVFVGGGTREEVERLVREAIASISKDSVPTGSLCRSLAPSSVPSRSHHRCRPRQLRDDKYKSIQERRLTRLTDQNGLEEIEQAIETVLRNYYPGSGGGRPRVPEQLPVMLGQMRSAVLRLAGVQSLDDAVGRRIEEEALLCHELIGRLLETCERVRRAAAPMIGQFRDSPRLGTRWDLVIEDRLAEGSLPFANSEICPVSSYGVMEPFKYGNPPELDDFAKAHLRDYEELDEIGSIANGWARQLALATRDVLAGQHKVAMGSRRR